MRSKATENLHDMVIENWPEHVKNCCRDAHHLKQSDKEGSYRSETKLF